MDPPVEQHLEVQPPTTADHSPEKSSLEYQLDPVALKNLYPYSTTIESHTSQPQEYSGNNLCQKGQEPLRNTQGLPSPGVPHTGFASGPFAFPLQDSNGVFLPFIIHISNYGRTNSKEIVSLQTVSLTQIICPPGFHANDPTHDSSNQKIIIANALRLSVVHSSAWVAFCFPEGVSLG